jgi:hypothetical protein
MMGLAKVGPEEHMRDQKVFDFYSCAVKRSRGPDHAPDH